MKKKLTAAGIVLAVLLTIWTTVSIVLLRGAGAYRIGTKLGSTLAISRPYTLTAAILLIAALLILLATRKNRKPAAIPAAPGDSNNEGLPLPKPKKEKKVKKEKTGGKKTVPAAVEAKIAPMPPMEDNETVLVHHTEDLTGGRGAPLIPPATPAQESVTVLAAPAAAETSTILLSVEETHAEPEISDFLPIPEEGAPQIQTAPPFENPENDNVTQIMPVTDNAVPCCPACGTPVVKEGQRFCAKCGAELKGGGK